MNGLKLYNAWGAKLKAIVRTIIDDMQIKENFLKLLISKEKVIEDEGY
jgi:hypothetical protein